jgi:hypothetical protein
MLVFAGKYSYTCPTHVVKLINNIYHMNENTNIIFLFGRFTDFDVKCHNSALSYLFGKTILRKKVISEDETNYHITYAFDNVKDVIKQLNKDQMLFLCGILHAIDLKPFLLALLSIMINELKMNFDDIKLFGRSDKFKLSIYYK